MGRLLTQCRDTTVLVNFQVVGTLDAVLAVSKVPELELVGNLQVFQDQCDLVGIRARVVGVERECLHRG